MDPSCLWLPFLAEKEAERKRKGQAARAYHTERKRVQGQEPAPTAEGGCGVPTSAVDVEEFEVITESTGPRTSLTATPRMPTYRVADAEQTIFWEV